jgi:hypothetical protein
MFAFVVVVCLYAIYFGALDGFVRHSIGMSRGGNATVYRGSSAEVVGALTILSAIGMICIGWLRLVRNVGLPSPGSPTAVTEQLQAPQLRQIAIITVVLIFITAFIAYEALNGGSSGSTFQSDRLPLILSARAVWKRIDQHALSVAPHAVSSFDSSNPPAWWDRVSRPAARLVPGVRYEVPGDVVGVRLDRLKKGANVLTLSGEPVTGAFGGAWSLAY